jgi:hypothetical protein
VGGDVDFETISAAEINSLKPGFGRKKTVENVA